MRLKHRIQWVWTLAVVLVILAPVVLAMMFLSNYCCSTAGERLGALGGVLGGLLGALGAALAVFLTLRGQRRDEAETIRDAARREVQEFSRLVAGNLDTCRDIAAGTVRIPPGDLPTIMLMPKPVIYQAIADRIGRLDRAESYVTFYARIAEAERLVAILAARSQPPAIGEGRTPLPLPIGRKDIALVASSWIDIAGIAMHLLDPQPRPADFINQVDQSFRSRLEEAFRSARATFPDDPDAPLR
jgi:hypothetical protein